jgi:cell division protein FtsB
MGSWLMRPGKFDLAVMLACLTLLGFFGWHAFYGSRGFAYKEQLTAKAEKLQVELDQLVSERRRIDSRVQLIRPESIDPDLLDELARRALNFSKPGEIILINK